MALQAPAVSAPWAVTLGCSNVLVSGPELNGWNGVALRLAATSYILYNINIIYNSYNKLVGLSCTVRKGPHYQLIPLTTAGGGKE